MYAVPGNPLVLEYTTTLLRLRGAEAGIEIKVVHGISFLELALAEIPPDGFSGLQIVLPLLHLQEGRYRKDLPLLVCQIEAKSFNRDTPRVDLTMQWLLETYPPDHCVTLIWTEGLPFYRTQSKTMPLRNLLAEYRDGKYFASLYVPLL